MTSISNGESGSSVRTKLNASLAVTDAFSVSGGNLKVTANSASAALTVTQTGAGYSLLIEDSTSPDSSPFVVDASGNVGVGTTTIGQRLTVAGGEAGTNKINAVGTQYGSGSFLNAFTSAGGNDVGFSGFIASQVTNATNRLWAGVHSPSGTNSAFIGTPDATNFAIWTNSLRRMQVTSAGSVAIGSGAPSASSILDVQSTTLGVRFPNMTTAEKNAIANVAGNVVFDTTLGKLCVNSGSGWQTITSV